MKKFLKSATGILLIFAMLFSTLAISASAGNELIYYGRNELVKLSNGAALVEAYDVICNSLSVSDSPQLIDLKNTSKAVYRNEMRTIIDAIISDHPEFFWVSGGYGTSFDATSLRVKTLSLNYDFEGQALRSAQNQLNDVVAEMTRGLFGRTQYEKAKILYDRLILHNTYEKVGYHQTAYGALVNQKSVCAGYSAAYQLLLNEVGISAWTVEGTSGYSSHAWNIINIDGKDYFADATWDDDDRGDLTNVRYSYFCPRISDVSASHIPSSFYASVMNACYATDANYFVKNSLVFDDFDPDKLVEAFRKNGLTVTIYSTKGSSYLFDCFRDNYRYIRSKFPYVNGYTYGATSNTLFLRLNTTSCSHSNTVAEHNYEHHWNKCTNCGMFTSKDIHRYSGTSNKCVSCSYSYAIEQYTLSYNANGGTGAPAAQTGSTRYVIPSSTPTREGYTFLGWSDRSSATSPKFYPGTPVVLSADSTLYAVWQVKPVNSYTLSYNANGGTGAPAAQTGSKNYVIPSTIPSRSGYTFLGWSESSTATSPRFYPGGSVVLSADATLYAVWQVTEAYNSEPSIAIRNNPGTRVLSYGDTIKLTAEVKNAPAGSTVYWYCNGNYHGQGESHNFYCNSGGSYEITAVLVDANGTVIRTSVGQEVVSQPETFNIQSNIFLIIIAFLKELFGLNGLIVQSFTLM